MGPCGSANGRFSSIGVRSPRRDGRLWRGARIGSGCGRQITRGVKTEDAASVHPRRVQMVPPRWQCESNSCSKCVRPLSVLR